MNKKGFTLIELMIVIAILGIFFAIVLPPVIVWMKKENIASEAGSLVKEFKAAAADKNEQHTNSTEVKQGAPIRKTLESNNSVKCVEGKKFIVINGEEFALGKVKNKWGDIDPISCEEK